MEPLHPVAIAAILICVQPVASSQPATFEVATLKLAVGGGRRSRMVSNGTVTIHNESLINLLELAYDVSFFQVTVPDSIGALKYDIGAKAAGPVPESELKHMLQALLSERLHLVMHRETRQIPVMAMTVGKNGPKLTPAADNGPLQIAGEKGKAVLKNTTMAGLVTLLNGGSALPTVDRTGITGLYDITLDYRQYLDADGVPSMNAMMDAIRTAAEKQLGLRFSPTKAPVEFLIVDRADKVPIDN